jgi:hypothetical protein
MMLQEKRRKNVYCDVGVPSMLLVFSIIMLVFFCLLYHVYTLYVFTV